MSDAKLVNIARLMTSYNFEIEELPENLKCAQCKLVLKDACQLPCGCRFCRACIDDLMARGGEFCPGESEDCGESPLSRSVSDYLANTGVSRLAAKCLHDGCVHECQLANMEEHMRECPRKTEECPFHELGCTQDKLAAEEMGGHLQHEKRRHSEILIEMIANINREIETLKHELVLKDEQRRSIMDQMIHMQNDIKSIKEQIEREIAERRENDELDSARVIDHVNREIAAVTGLIGSNKDEMATQLQSVRGDIGSINQDVQSIKDDICSMKSQVQSTQVVVELGQFNASFVWLIEGNVAKTDWSWQSRLSESFYGMVHPYKYRLALSNYYIGTAHARLGILLLICFGLYDEHLAWPFEARVVITVTDWNRREACRSISLQCQFEKPRYNQYSFSAPFEFPHSELITAGLNLNSYVWLSCVIVHSAH